MEQLSSLSKPNYQSLKGTAYLHFDFPSPEQSLSWSIHSGGWRQLDSLTWLEVKNSDLDKNCEPRVFCRERLKQLNLPESSLCFLTSACVADFQLVELAYEDLLVQTTVTVGLGNALRVGDAIEARQLGTINILTRTNARLSQEAAIEAISMQTEAKTAALFDMQIKSIQKTGYATGTGTDCQAVCSAMTESPIIEYCGKHTALGMLIGQSVYQACSFGIKAWQNLQEKS